MIRPGEIYMADLVAAGRRPVLVVSRESLNRGNYVTIVSFTTGRLALRRELPNCVFFANGEFGLTADCVAQGETLSGISIDELDIARGPIGVLDEPSLRRVIHAVGFVLDSHCEPV